MIICEYYILLSCLFWLRFYKLHCCQHCFKLSEIHVDQRHISNTSSWMKSDTSLSGKLGVKAVIFWDFKTIPVPYLSLRVQSECGKMRTRITPNRNTFFAVRLSSFALFSLYLSFLEYIFSTSTMFHIFFALAFINSIKQWNAFPTLFSDVFTNLSR